MEFTTDKELQAKASHIRTKAFAKENIIKEESVIRRLSIFRNKLSEIIIRLHFFLYFVYPRIGYFYKVTNIEIVCYVTTCALCICLHISRSKNEILNQLSQIKKKNWDNTRLARFEVSEVNSLASLVWICSRSPRYLHHTHTKFFGRGILNYSLTFMSFSGVRSRELKLSKKRQPKGWTPTRFVPPHYIKLKRNNVASSLFWGFYCF